MESRALPTDQSSVSFTDKAGVSRKGKYVSEMKAFVEISNYEDPQDCSNVYPEGDIVQWDYIEGNFPDEVIAVL